MVELLANHEEARGEVDDLRADLDAVAKALDPVHFPGSHTLAEKVEKIVEEVERLTLERDTAMDGRDRLTERLTEAETKAQSLKQELKAVSDGTDGAGLREELAEARSRNKILAEQLQQSQQTAKSLEDATKHLGAQVTELRSKVGAVETKRFQSHQKLQQMEKELKRHTNPSQPVIPRVRRQSVTIDGPPGVAPPFETEHDLVARMEPILQRYQHTITGDLEQWKRTENEVGMVIAQLLPLLARMPAGYQDGQTMETLLSRVKRLLDIGRTTIERRASIKEEFDRLLRS